MEANRGLVTRTRRYMYFFCGSFVFFVSCVSHAFASVQCCLVATFWERADLLTLVGDVYCSFVTFPCGILGQVWYLIVSFPDICRLSYFVTFDFWLIVDSALFNVPPIACWDFVFGPYLNMHYSLSYLVLQSS